MKESKNRFLAFSFGDYEGLRVYLDRQAAQGWELVGRSGWLTGKFVPTNRTELRYDVVPAQLRRSQETLQAEVETRRAAGWEPVDTVWGMDIYKSLPCQLPELFREGKDRSKFKSIFLDWLIWSAAFIAVTLAALFVAWCLCLMSLSGGLSRGIWIDLTHNWYLSDSRTALCLLLPLLGVLALLWLGWLAFCLLRRRGDHRPGRQGMLFVRGILQLIAIGAAALLLVVLWVDAIPRLWLRVTLVLCFAAVPLVAHLIGRGDRRRRILALGTGLFACFAAAMVLSWTVQPIFYYTPTQGNSWRTQLEHAPILRAEDLGLNVEGQAVSASYRVDGSLLVTRKNYAEYWNGSQYPEHWNDGHRVEVTEYTCRLPWVADLLLSDLVPELSSDDLPVIDGRNGVYQLWYREGNRLIYVVGTADWSDDALREKAMELLSR
ncbi:MAG: DUF2812 domain-containing protein [Oscillospiraceae bacterium]|nr:DUF2812 domain-containing protein [Oscillospiraceae bacterium]